MINLDSFINDRVEETNISCRTLIVTIFGDVVSQHGKWIWLGSLINSLRPFGYSERLVRTSVYRLVKDDWLQVKKIGRKSYYQLTTSAINHYKKAARRIYSKSILSSDNRWLILFPSFVEETKMSELKRQLKWLGFSALSSGAFAHPCFDQESIEETIQELDIVDSVIIFSGKTIDGNSANVLKKLVYQKWNLDSLQQAYNSFIDTYTPIFDFLNETVANNRHRSNLNEQHFLLRVLLIHEYRRILLQDHELPSDMLPKNWSGYQANRLVKDLYSFLADKSCYYITHKLEAVNGFLPEASSDFDKRFK